MLLTLLQILKAWLEIKAKRANWQLEVDISRYCDELENKIIEARGLGNDALADRLRERFTRSSGLLVSNKGNPQA
jgi:hypothetical protein